MCNNGLGLNKDRLERALILTICVGPIGKHCHDLRKRAQYNYLVAKKANYMRWLNLNFRRWACFIYIFTS